MELQYQGKLYMVVNGQRVLGPGRVQLLELIGVTGSIRQAAIQMNMSYRQAWQFIAHMNTHLEAPVVVLTRGGKGGGKAAVTDKGIALINTFKDFHLKFEKFLAANSLQLDF